MFAEPAFPIIKEAYYLRFGSRSPLRLVVLRPTALELLLELIKLVIQELFAKSIEKLEYFLQPADLFVRQLLV